MGVGDASRNERHIVIARRSLLCKLRKQLRISEANRSLLGESIENVRRSLMNMLMSLENKVYRKNPRYIPKITINRELFSRAIEKNK